MSDKLNKLYRVMQEKYQLWASAKRPSTYHWEDASLVHNPEFLEKFGSFRNKEWDEYVRAREEYLRAMKLRSVQ